MSNQSGRCACTIEDKGMALHPCGPYHCVSYSFCGPTSLPPCADVMAGVLHSCVNLTHCGPVSSLTHLWDYRMLLRASACMAAALRPMARQASQALRPPPPPRHMLPWHTPLACRPTSPRSSPRVIPSTSHWQRAAAAGVWVYLEVEVWCSWKGLCVVKCSC